MSEMLDNSTSHVASISVESKSFLIESAKWGRFLAIVGFVMLGIMVIASLFMIGAAASIRGMGGQAAMMGIIYLVMVALYFFPTFYLFKFSTKIKAGLTGGSQDDTTEGFQNLKSMFKFMGILMIVVLSFYALMLLIGLLGVALS